MAKTTKKAATKKAAPAAKKAATPAAPKPLKEVLNKSGLIKHLSEISQVPAKDVKAVLVALEHSINGAVNKKGVGAFTLPGLFKVSVQKIPAKPKRKGINPFTKEEVVFAAKPASVKVKIRPLKQLRDAAML